MAKYPGQDTDRRIEEVRLAEIATRLFAACGMLLLTMAAELITLFIALEIMSLAIYVLIAADRRSVLRSEAVLKYLMLGAFAGAFFVMGSVFTVVSLSYFFIRGAVGRPFTWKLSGREGVSQSKGKGHQRDPN